MDALTGQVKQGRFLQGPLSVYFDIFSEFGTIEKMLKSDWKPWLQRWESGDKNLGVALKALNSCGGSPDQIRHVVSGFDEDMKNCIAVAIAHEYAVFYTRTAVH